MWDAAAAGKPQQGSLEENVDPSLARTWFPACTSLRATQQREAKATFARHQSKSIERQKEQCDACGAIQLQSPASPELHAMVHERASPLAFSAAPHSHRKR